MGLQEINRVVEEAERQKNEVIQFSVIYSEALDGYRHSRHAGEVPGDLEPVSAQELYHETRKFVERIDKHERWMEKLEEVERALDRVNDHHFLPESELTREQVQNYLQNVYEDYEENLDHAREVCFRGESVQEAMSLMDIKSDLRRDPDPFRENLEIISMLEKGY